jgi:hypothetical protein
MQPCRLLDTSQQIGFVAGHLVDVLPERHREALAPNGFAGDKRARGHHRVTVIGEPARHRQLRTLLCGLGVGRRRVRRRKHCRYAHHHWFRGEVHDDGEHVVEHPRIVGPETEVPAGGGGGRHRACGPFGDLVGGQHVGRVSAAPRSEQVAQHVSDVLR